MIENKICEGTDCLSTALSSGMTSLLVKGCFCEKCELKEQWSSDIPLSCTISKCTDMQYANTSFRNIIYAPHWSYSPFTQKDNTLLPLLFLRSLSIVSGCHIINIRCCHLDRKLWIIPMAFHPHTEFRYSKLLTYLSYDYGSFSNIPGMDLGLGGYRKVSI